MRLRILLSLVCASLLAAACYQSDSSGGGSQANASICSSFCNENAEAGCTSPSVENCGTECETALENLGPCAQGWREVMQCAVNAGITCEMDGTSILPQDCRPELESYDACLQTNFDAGSN